MLNPNKVAYVVDGLMRRLVNEVDDRRLKSLQILSEDVFEALTNEATFGNGSEEDVAAWEALIETIVE
jgi:hypothetical protein